MRPAVFLLPLILLAACDSAGMSGLTASLGLPGSEPDVPPGPPPLPAAVAAVLPPGTPSSLVFLNTDGCYLFSVEVTDPPSGFPITDAAGNPICEGQPVTVLASALPASDAAAVDAAQ